LEEKMKLFRCPIDDVVFETVNVHRTPTLQGHPECPGPVCRKSAKDGNFKAHKDAEVAKPIAVASVVQPGVAADAPEDGRIPLGQGW
jgi:hypothetical protein